MSQDNQGKVPSAEALIAKARAITNIDIADPAVVEPLSVLVNSLNTESHLHARGAVAMEGKLVHLLCNRLRMMRDLRNNPEIENQNILKPVMLCGLPRTGTTKLQHVLAAIGDFNFLPLWQAWNPALISGSRDESPQQRIDEADAFWRYFNEASPEAIVGHLFEARTADEDTHVQEHCFLSSSHFAYSEVPSYLAYYAAQNPRIQFDYLKTALKYLQWQGLQRENVPWMLKCPINVGMQPLLRAVFPDALLVMTHRDPVDLVASACSLLDSFHKPFTHDNGNYQAVVQGFVWQINQHMADREKHDLNLLDVHYLDAVGNVEAVVEKVYARAGLVLSDRARQRIHDWERDNPQHRHGVHKYSLQQYGFERAQLDTYFGDYRRMMDQMFGNRSATK